MDAERKSNSPREYPPFWERAVPVILTILGVVIVGMIIVAFLVALGLFPGSV
jgi:uncharacterized integral membrane protein